MKHLPSLAVLAWLTLAWCPSAPAQPYAATVVQYSPGAGAATGYQDPSAALGLPSSTVPGFPSGSDPVTPYNPPYQQDQLVSIGAGGSLTVQFAEPVNNAPANPFGLDFLIFGNNGFVIVNGDYSDKGITDGSLFKAPGDGVAHVWVSADNVTYYQLVAPHGLSAQLNGLFPTDSAGNPRLPVDPQLAGSDFAGLDLAGIRALYHGSAGGTGFDLAWAQTADGQPADLAQIRYARIDVASGHLEVDSFMTVPEPAAWLQFLLGAGLLAVSLCWSRRARG